MRWTLSTPHLNASSTIASLDLVALISRYLPLRKQGKHWWGLCPFHEDHCPSLAVNPGQQLFYCFGCRTGGDAATFIMKILGLSFPEAIRRLGEMTKTLSTPPDRSPINEPTMSPEQLLPILEAATRFYYAVLARQGARAQQVLQARGVTEEMRDRFRIGYAPDSWGAVTKFLQRRGFPLEACSGAGLTILRKKTGGGFDRFRNRLMFPLMNLTGKSIAFGGWSLNPTEPMRYINSPESTVFQKGKILYGLLQARRAIEQGRQAILVEGYFDVLAMHRTGYRNTLGCMGNRVTEHHASLLGRLGARVITLLFDGDAEGRTAAARAREILAATGLQARIATLPEGEDPDSFLRHAGPEEMARVLKTANLFP